MRLFRSRTSGQDAQRPSLDEFVRAALDRLADEAAAGRRQTRITFRVDDIEMPDGSWWTALPGKVAQSIQDAGYFIQYAETEGTTGVVVVNIPLRT